MLTGVFWSQCACTDMMGYSDHTSRLLRTSLSLSCLGLLSRVFSSKSAQQAVIASLMRGTPDCAILQATRFCALHTLIPVDTALGCKPHAGTIQH